MRTQARRGFTLIELVIALAVSGVLLALVGSLFVASLSAWRRGQDLREAQALASTVVDVVARDVRSASQAPSVTIRPRLPVDEGEPILSITAPATDAGTGPAWILYLFLPERGELLRQVVTFSPGGRVRLRDSRLVGRGVTKVSVDQVAEGVRIEVEVQRGRASAQGRATAVPRNP